MGLIKVDTKQVPVKRPLLLSTVKLGIFFYRQNLK